MDKKDEVRTRRLSVDEQATAQDRLYDMSIRFVGDVEPAGLNDILRSLGGGSGERAVIRNAVTLRLRQVVPFIPDDKTLTRYAEAMLQAQSKGPKKADEVTVSNLRFDGYDWIYAVIPDNTVPDGTEHAETGRAGNRT